MLAKAAARLVLVVAGLLSVAACATAPSPYTPMDGDEREPGVYMEMLEATYSDNWFSVRVLFQENLVEYDGVVQEIQIDSNGDGLYDWTLVEYFKLDGGHLPPGIFDRHSGSDRHRKMTVYPANVEGVDYMMGVFAQLPKNKDGSRVTRIPEGFNLKYVENHSTIGTVVSAAPELAITWEIEFDPKQRSLKVTLPKE